MSKKQDWLDVYHEESNVIQCWVYDFYRFAEAFNVVGNSYMYRHFLKAAVHIEDSLKKMDEAISQNINEGLKRAQDNSRVILEAALDGVILGSEDNKEKKKTKKGIKSKSNLSV